MNQQKQVSIKWSPSFAYLIGMIATDGNLSPDERHIVVTSKDKKLLENIKERFLLPTKIGSKSNGISREKKYSVLQIGDKNFYNFLVSIGLTKNKSKTISKIIVPRKYFFHFLRGCLDGDGNIDIYTHKESNHKQLRIRLASASSEFLNWIAKEINENCASVGGWIYSPKNKSWHVLTYGKKDSIEILKRIYKNKTLFLERKFIQAKEFI
jgi:hypothetical protein